MFTGVIISGGVVFALSIFGLGYTFSRGFFRRQMTCHVEDCRRFCHGLIRERAFAKGASNMGAVVPGALEPGMFGRG